MYFCIHFRIHINQHFQSSFSTPRFLLKKQHFPFGTGFAYSCMSGKLPGNNPLTKEHTMNPFVLFVAATAELIYFLSQEDR